MLSLHRVPSPQRVLAFAENDKTCDKKLLSEASVFVLSTAAQKEAWVLLQGDKRPFVVGFTNRLQIGIRRTTPAPNGELQHQGSSAVCGKSPRRARAVAAMYSTVNEFFF